MSVTWDGSLITTSRNIILNLPAGEDASWKFVEDKRWGFFPSVSGGWRISKEPFYTSSSINNVLNDVKLRVSYGKLGDDNVGIGAFDYIVGYNYPTGPSILDGTRSEYIDAKQSGARDEHFVVHQYNYRCWC